MSLDAAGLRAPRGSVPHLAPADRSLIGIGLYTPLEAGRWLDIAPAKISRWLVGHQVRGRRYQPLWSPQVDLGEHGIALGFRDLIEVRVADAFISHGVGAQRVRRTIELAREILGEDRPLSTARFRTDGRSIFLQIAEDDDANLVDVFSSQYAFREVIEPSLKNVDMGEDGLPARWWPMGKAKSIVLDPARCFGQPIEAETSVPTSSLAAAVRSEGSVEAAARIWNVPARAARRAWAFETQVELRHAL